MTGLLKTINDPADLRRLPRAQLRTVADELRACVLENVSRTGGHLSSNLGTVELTVALHYVLVLLCSWITSIALTRLARKARVVGLLLMGK